VNLSNVSRLHIFSLETTIKCNEPRFEVLHDINIVLGTIPGSNRLTSLVFNFAITGRHPSREYQDWDGMYNEVIRISDGKPLEVELQVGIFTTKVEGCNQDDDLYMYIVGKAESLSDYPKICFHILDLGLRPYLRRRQVCSRCTGRR
jgi:hypothetical protein